MTKMIKAFFAKCIRVWHILRKPDMKEFKEVSKISALGILLLGLIGFLIALIINLF